MEQQNHPVSEALKAKIEAPHVDEVDIAKVWAGVQSRLDTIPANRPRSNFWRYTSIAASALVLVLGASYAVRYSAVRTKTVTYSTKAGQRATITLPSGAQVVLAPVTKIVVNGNDIDLDGQALFTVKHNSKSPFTVHAANSVTRVLGTTFAVRAYHTDSSVRIFVTEGKVGVGNNAILVAGDAAKVERNGQVIPITNLDLTTALGWTEGKLVFRKATLSSVLSELERIYDVQFVVDNEELAASEVTTTLMDGDIRNTMYKLSDLLNAKYSVKGRTITFTRNK